MADVLGPSGKQSGLITLLQEQNQIWIYFSFAHTANLSIRRGLIIRRLFSLRVGQAVPSC
jgi:hypothetical protein